MSRLDVETLLRDAAKLDETPEGAMPEDETLKAYRSGTLPPAAARRLEALLARHPEARRRLLDLGGVEPASLSPEVRRQVLDALPGAARRPAGRRWWPAAAAVAAALLAVVGLQLRPPPPLPETLAYEVSGFGVADVRSRPTADGVITAYAETVVRLEVVPGNVAEHGLEIGLYRARGGRLERVPVAADRVRETSRGGVVFRLPAAELVGAEPGAQRVWVTVARRGDLPAAVAIGPSGTATEALAAGGRRLVYPQEIELMPAPPGTAPPETEDQEDSS